MTKGSPDSRPPDPTHVPPSAPAAHDGKDAVDLLREGRKVERHHVGPHLLGYHRDKVRRLTAEQRRSLREEIAKQSRETTHDQIRTHLAHLHDVVQEAQTAQEQARDFVTDTFARGRALFGEKIDTLKSDKAGVQEKLLAGATLASPLVIGGAALLLALAFREKDVHFAPVIGADGKPVLEKDGSPKLQKITDRKISTFGKILMGTGLLAGLFAMVRWFGGGAMDRRKQKEAEEQATAQAEAMKEADGTLPLDTIPKDAVVDGKRLSFVGTDGKKRVFSIAPGGDAATVEVGGARYAMKALDGSTEEAPKIHRVNPGQRGVRFFYDAGPAQLFVHLDKEQIEHIERELAKPGDSERRIKVVTRIPVAEIKAPLDAVTKVVTERIEKQGGKRAGDEYVVETTFVFRKLDGASDPAAKPPEGAKTAAPKKKPSPIDDIPGEMKYLDKVQLEKADPKSALVKKGEKTNVLRPIEWNDAGTARSFGLSMHHVKETGKKELKHELRFAAKEKDKDTFSEYRMSIGNELFRLFPGLSVASVSPSPGGGLQIQASHPVEFESPKMTVNVPARATLGPDALRDTLSKLQSHPEEAVIPLTLELDVKQFLLPAWKSRAEEMLRKMNELLKGADAKKKTGSDTVWLVTVPMTFEKMPSK